MKPAGYIGTYMDLKKIKGWWFNIPLFLWQLTFLVVGTVYGKIKWPKLERWQDRAIGVIFMWAFIPFMWFFPKWWSTPILIIGAFIGIATFRSIPWRRVWRAAQVSHVRLVLRPKSWFLCFDGDPKTNFEGNFVANFGYPTMEIQPWRESWNDGKRFEYRDPAFETPPAFVAAMIEYAEAQVGKRYDKWQLFSYALNFIVWLFWWPSWGREVFRWLNLRGNHEVCSSGVTACLRWAYLIRYGYSPASAHKMLLEGYAEYGTLFFEGYDTAMVSPCLVPLSENWREHES